MREACQAGYESQQRDMQAPNQDHTDDAAAGGADRREHESDAGKTEKQPRCRAEVRHRVAGQPFQIKNLAHGYVGIPGGRKASVGVARVLKSRAD